MTKQVERYYYFDEETRTVFHSETLEERPDLIFLGSSLNTNIRMTASVMVKQLNSPSGYKIKPLY